MSFTYLIVTKPVKTARPDGAAFDERVLRFRELRDGRTHALSLRLRSGVETAAAINFAKSHIEALRSAADSLYPIEEVIVVGALSGAYHAQLEHDDDDDEAAAAAHEGEGALDDDVEEGAGMAVGKSGDDDKSKNEALDDEDDEEGDEAEQEDFDEADDAEAKHLWVWWEGHDLFEDGEW